MCENNVVDEYQHPTSAVLYTPWNIPGPGIDVEEFESQLASGCDCNDGLCTSQSTCSCISRFGSNYSDHGHLLDSKFDGPVIECNSVCACFGKGKCGNRVVQYGPLNNLEVFPSENESKGFALRCKTKICRGTFICEYAGEVIGLEEAKFRVQSNKDMNYVFVLNEHLSDGRVVKTCVDPRVIGNIGRYINHSCDPNCGMIPVRIDSPVPKLCIFAIRVLEAGEEITFHYGGGLKENCVTSLEKRKNCLCGSVNCTKYLPFDSGSL